MVSKKYQVQYNMKRIEQNRLDTYTESCFQGHFYVMKILSDFTLEQMLLKDSEHGKNMFISAC